MIKDYLNYQMVTSSNIIFKTCMIWAVISLLLTLLITFHMHYRLIIPIRELSKATKLVANGDFSVYVPTRHTTDKLDDLDVIFLDFNKMVEELGSIETLKTDFFSNVSHEMKTPIAVIQNSAEMLQKGTLSIEEQHSYIDNIIKTSKKLSKLITNILKINKLEKQTIKPQFAKFDVCTQLCDSYILFESKFDEKNIEFVANIEDERAINSDSELLEHVWNNLISNAIKFTEIGGTITVEQTSTDTEIIVSISDTGCGMDKETLKHIFDKFYQGDTSHATEGNGLGLALVFRIIQLLDGTISVSSVVDKGTTFTVTLPINLEEGHCE